MARTGRTDRTATGITTRNKLGAARQTDPIWETIYGVPAAWEKLVLFERFTRRRKRSHEKCHEGLGDQTHRIIGDVAIHYGKVPADSHYASIRRYAAAFHPFQVVDLHFDRGDTCPERARHIARQPSGRIRKRGQDPAVNYAMDLQVTSIHFKAKQHAPPRGFHETKTHLLRGAVFFQATPQLLYGDAL
jgi:hypothetical protein